ncbi:MAG: kelch repeat-containing protein, partial [Thermoplasmata archaeon]
MAAGTRSGSSIRGSHSLLAFGMIAVVIIVAAPSVGATPRTHAGSAPWAASSRMVRSGSEPSHDPVGGINSTFNWSWSLLSTPSLGNVSAAGLAADGGTGLAVLFGGMLPSGGLTNSTYLYNESKNTWTPLSSSGAPSPRSDVSMASDPQTGAAVVFGGLADPAKGQPNVDNGTYRFNFATHAWTLAPRGLAPRPREDAAFAIDPSAGVGLLFGGWDPDYGGVGVLTYSDTWELNLSSLRWTNVTAATGISPPPMHGSSLVWDPAAAVFYMVGGCFPCTPAMWSFNPGTLHWALVTTTGVVPSGRMNAAWMWDPDQNVGLLYGGTAGASPLNDTHVFNATNDTWLLLPSTPFPSGRAFAAVDWLSSANNATGLVVGGNTSHGPTSEIWRLAPTATLSVNVNSAVTGAGIGRAGVTINNGTVYSTGPTGQLNLSQVSPTEAIVNVTAPGFATASRALWISPGLATTLTFALAPIPPGNVDVHILGPGGQGLVGATVNLLVRGLLLVAPALLTNAFGFANYSKVPAATGTIQVVASGYHLLNASAVFPSALTARYTLTPSPLAQLHIAAIGVVESQVLPLVGVSIFLNSTALGVTASNGWLNTTVNVTGRMQVTVNATGFDPGSSNVTIPYSGIRYVNLTLIAEPLAHLAILVEAAATGLAIG